MLNYCSLSLRLYLSCLISICALPYSFAQNPEAGRGIGSLKLGMNTGEVEWELGFRGFWTEREDASENELYLARIHGIDFDYVLHYEHIMWLPIRSVFFSNGRANLIEVSSYPEYFRMLCSDMSTERGLGFWVDQDVIKAAYGRTRVHKSGGKQYMVYKKEGLGMQLENGELRSMCIFKPPMP